MGIVRRVVNRLRRAWYGPSGYLRETWDREERVAYLERVVEYLTWQTSHQATLLRHLAVPVIHDLPGVAQTKASFDFQWAELPAGRYMPDNAQFRAEAPDYVCQFTSLPREWFAGKTVFDVGCGLGRYSVALCQLGADVVSMDQSDQGLRKTAESCRDFPRHRTIKIDLLEPIPFTEQADLVWCFGVLHHTGDTHGAFQRVAPLVKPGGHLYMMIYGEPRPLFPLDYEEINEYDYWRQRTATLGLEAKARVIRQAMAKREFRVVGDEHVHGYFDAISPPINDLYTFEELEAWLIDAGFADIRRTVETRNHHLIARRRTNA